MYSSISLQKRISRKSTEIAIEIYKHQDLTRCHNYLKNGCRTTCMPLYKCTLCIFIAEHIVHVYCPPFNLVAKMSFTLRLT